MKKIPAKILNNISLLTGFFLLPGGLLIYGLSMHGLINIVNHKLPEVIMILGAGLLTAGACELFIKTNKEQQIEANDERNIIIGKTAKSFAFDLMTILLSVTMLLLILFDYISMGAFFTLFGVYMISQTAFILSPLPSPQRSAPSPLPRITLPRPAATLPVDNSHI